MPSKSIELELYETCEDIKNNVLNKSKSIDDIFLKIEINSRKNLSRHKFVCGLSVPQ